jgi:Domain of unknown function (DUF397)
MSESLIWIKSSYSAAQGDCVEVAALPDNGIAMRDSKDPDGGVLRFTSAQWQALLNAVKSGES